MIDRVDNVSDANRHPRLQPQENSRFAPSAEYSKYRVTNHHHNNKSCFPTDYYATTRFFNTYACRAAAFLSKNIDATKENLPAHTVMAIVLSCYRVRLGGVTVVIKE